MFLKKFTLLATLLIILLQTTMAQKDNNYSKQWASIEAFEKKGLTKSALTEVVKIYQLALKEGNTTQQIKSSIYQIRYRNELDENSNENNIFFVDTLITTAKSPAKNILQSMQAEMLWQYQQNNRWKLYNRTTVANEKAKDISTWSLDKLHATISKLYKASISNEALLKQTKLDPFDAIIIKEENTRQLRPTLFDFLGHRALEYFKTDERDLNKPAYQFTINDAAAFAPAEQFVKHRFNSKDSTSLHYQALLLLQRLEAFHLADASKDAMLDADLQRLLFVKQYAVNENKDALYEAALQQFEKNNTDNPFAAQAMYLRATIYQAKGQQYDPFSNSGNQYELKRAMELCEAAISKYPNSEGGINAQNMKQQLLQPSLNLETEQVNLPGQPFRTLVEYKNVPALYFRIIKTTRAQLNKLDKRDYQQLWQSYTAMKPLTSWSVNLPDPKDFQEHRTEIKVDAVDNGLYVILASVKPDFSLQQNIIAKQVVHVSNISYIHEDDGDYYVLHRDNGEPLANTVAQIWQSEYNNKTNQYEDKKAEQYTADKNGHFQVKKTTEYRNFRMQLINGKDELFLDNTSYYGVYNSAQTEELRPVTFLFTDRSIYRPGQTMYFKGIVLKNGNKTTRASVLPSFATTVEMHDANGQKVSELKLTTNEYGSYHGSFKLPEGSLNGQFNLVDANTSGNQSFNVEEYKRPKFFTEINKPAGTYRVNDSITVTGTAKAYAGNNVDGAAVKYRVVRKVRYPIWWSYGYSRRGGRSMPWGRNEEVEITNGNTVTDASGSFKITFKALPDERIAKKDQPTFYYEVSADVTDLNGETRSGETSVAVAYQSLKLEIQLADKLPADSLKTILVKSTNLNDLQEPASINLTIQALKSPAKIFRERYWQQPDQYVMTKAEYDAAFPYDVYSNENEVQHYELGDQLFAKTDSSNKAWPLGTSLKAGWYKIVATTKDKYGEAAKAEKYVLITSKDANLNTEPITISVDQKNLQPGETIRYQVQTGFDKLWLIHGIAKMNQEEQITYPSVTSTKPFTNEIAITEADRGGMAINYAFVQHNRVYNGEQAIAIPWSNKELNISYQTFRDKILPGAEEKWTVKISGNKGDKVAAELLAGMYDASLDQFKPHGWSRLNIFPTLYNYKRWANDGFNEVQSEEFYNLRDRGLIAKSKAYDVLINAQREVLTRNKSIYAWSKAAAPAARSDGGLMNKKITSLEENGDMMVETSAVGFLSIGNGDRASKMEDVKADQDKGKQAGDNGTIQVRTNFNETAFFFPNLTTDADGNVSFSATLPEALTQWKLMTLAHTKELASAYNEQTLVTQKPLMVQPNAPRFMREGDQMEFTAKIVNLSDSELTGTATLELLDAATNKPIDGWFKNVFPNQYFTAAAGQSVAVKFPVEIPFNFNSAMTYRIIARSTNQASGNFSDGEEMAIPVLTNRMLVTESLPIHLKGTEQQKTFTFDKLLKSGSSSSITQHALTVEYTSNPVWYAVQALPYLMEYPYDCAEQTFNRYYANTLAGSIVNSMPRIKSIFEQWKNVDTAALISNLQKNEALKSALLQETPWVLQAQNETQQKKNIALLFDLVKMNAEGAKAINTLEELQNESGGFTWFKGGQDDRYMTQYILTGIGHLMQLKALSPNNASQWQPISIIIAKALPYLDRKIKEDYDQLVKSKAKLTGNNLGYTSIQYLYMRSFFSQQPIAAASTKAVSYYQSQAKKYWLSNSKYMQAMLALVMQRSNNATTGKAIIASLKENSINNEELGMYWKEWNNRGWFWHQAPIESQALMIEAFTEIDKNPATIDQLKTWLLQQKRTQNWGTTRATSEACYALLLNGTNWLAEETSVSIQLGNKTIQPSTTEAGTGYFKETIPAKDVQPEFGNIKVSLKSAGTQVPLSGGGGGWGAIYWQYFEDLDKITPSATPLKLVKKLFVERNSDHGPVLEALADGATLKVGDKVKVRIELRVDRDMEYVHMKDMRAACMEPVNVLSGYKYQGGLGYYESTKDASTNFFFSWLNKGTYVFEYPLFVTHEGNFSNGITSIQCMYAPEFTSHSEGVRVTVEK